MPRKPTTSKIKGFSKGDLVWLDKKFAVDDNIYCVESMIHRERSDGEPYPSLLRLRLVFRVFYSSAHMDAFHSYDETLCSPLDAKHIEEMQAKFGAIIMDIATLYEARKKEQLNANSNRPLKPAGERKAVEPKSDKCPSPRSRGKKAM